MEPKLSGGEKEEIKANEVMGRICRTGKSRWRGWVSQQKGAKQKGSGSCGKCLPRL